MIERRPFLLALGATALAPALLAASTDNTTDEPLARALVLSGGGARVLALFKPEEDVLELVHPGVGEEQRGIAVGNERGAADAAVTFALEEFQKLLADSVAAPKLWQCGFAGQVSLV